MRRAFVASSAQWVYISRATMGKDRRESDLLEEERRLEASERELLKAERGQLGRVITVMRLADFMAILMVAATLFSAYSVWRTSLVTARIFSVSDRPFIGVQSVRFEQTGSGTPAIVVDFRNFGRIPADGALTSVLALVNGKTVKQRGDKKTATQQGNVSPGVPHFSYAFIPANDYKNVIAGKSRLMVKVNIEYQGPSRAGHYCYFERMIYDFHVASFRHVGGSDKCPNTDIF